MAVVPVSLEIIFLLLTGGSLGGGALPIGLPPGPGDPMLAHVAPEQCLAYLSWNAMADPDPASSNSTEQLLAEEEIQRFVSQTTKAILQKMQQQARGREEDIVMAVTLPKLIRALITNGTAIYVRPGSGIPSGGMLCRVGENAKRVERWLAQVQGVITEEPVLSDEGIYNWPVAPGAPALQWTINEGCVLIGFGDGELNDLLQRCEEGNTPAWLTKITNRLPVDRPASVLHVNASSIMEIMTQMMPPEASVALAASGIQNILSLNTVTGLDDTGTVSRTWLKTTGDRTGLLGLLEARPLTTGDLQSIPADVRIASVFRLDPSKILSKVLEVLEEVEPQSAIMVRNQLAQSRQLVGMDVEEDILRSIGDSWKIYQSPSEGGDPVTGWTAVVSVRRPEKLRDLTNILRGFVAAQNPNPRNQVRIDTFEAGRYNGHFVNVIGEEVPVAPAWCVTDTELVISLYPQGVRSYVNRSADSKFLSEVPLVRKRLGDNSIAFGYADTAALLELAWPFIRGGAAVLAGELQKDGVALNISLLPSRNTILQHMQPATSSLRMTNDGIEIIQHRTVPVGLESLAVAGTMTFLTQPRGRPSTIAMALSPTATRRTQSMNNLKIILLGMHNYHDVYNHFPPSETKLEKGAGLSWRVHLLPFLDQAPLYQQFRMDEPWDSEHNKTLIPLIPQVYRAPGSRSDATKTNYLGIQAKGSILEKQENQPLGFRDIIDGTSNTIMVVEADDEHAVVWTKPDDLNWDKDKPKKGLKSPSARGGFLAAMADGSIRIIQENIDDEMIRRLFLRNDGEVVREF